MKEQPEGCPLSPSPPGFWGQEPLGAFLAAPTASLSQGQVCVSGVASHSKSPCGTGDQRTSYPPGQILRFVPVLAKLWPFLLEMGSRGSRQVPHAVGLLLLARSQELPAPSHGSAAPGAGRLLGETKGGNSRAEPLLLPTLLVTRGQGMCFQVLKGALRASLLQPALRGDPAGTRAVCAMGTAVNNVWLFRRVQRSREEKYS